MSATSTKTHSASSKSSRKVAFAENASLDPESRVCCYVCRKTNFSIS